MSRSIEIVQYQHAQLSHALKPGIVREQGSAATGKRRGDLERVGCAQAVAGAETGCLLGISAVIGSSAKFRLRSKKRR